MIVVIQCAASKRPDAGYFLAQDGSRVLFVAHPEQAPAAENLIYSRPDDTAGQGLSWRELVVRYNDTRSHNPFGLSTAFELYGNDAYRNLVSKFGIENTYILSAGWGLISASFLTPMYDITFSSAADRYKRRSHNDAYRDLCMLPEGSSEPIVFFGGKDYVPLFVKLTRWHRGPRTVFYNSTKRPDVPGCALQRFDTTTRTNWHYECVSAFIAGTLVRAT